MRIFRMIAATVIASIAMGFSQEDGSEPSVTISGKQGVNLKIGGMFSMENGQFINAYFTQRPMRDRPWLYRGVGQLRMNAHINEHVSLAFAPQIRLWFDSYSPEVWSNEAFSHPFSQRSTASFAEAQGTVSFGDSENVLWDCSAGIMPFKYSPSKNLGEYLFRSGARPCFVYTDFDYPYATLTGLRLGSTVLKNCSAHVFLTTQTLVIPSLDWSLSGIVNYSFPGYLDVGAGLMFDRLFPVSKTANTPEDAQHNQYKTADGQKEFFSFGGTKAMAHVSFDPKGFFPEWARESLFGKEDLNIYGEIAVLGLKNIDTYTYYKDTATGQQDTTRIVFDPTMAYYHDISQRMPVMVGITIPTFKIFDYVSLEVEYFPWPYSNSMGKSGFSIPLPLPVTNKDIPADDYKKDNLKYSINAKATIWSTISLIGQIARDNSRAEVYEPSMFAQNYGECVFIKDNGWGWWLKIQYAF